jgi:hypothetical protein
MRQLRMGLSLAFVLGLALAGCGKKKAGGGGGGGSDGFKDMASVIAATQALKDAACACTDVACTQKLALVQPDPLGGKAMAIADKATQAEKDQYTSLKGEFAGCVMKIK